MMKIVEAAFVSCHRCVLGTEDFVRQIDWKVLR
jgi:hypothetical protein